MSVEKAREIRELFQASLLSHEEAGPALIQTEIGRDAFRSAPHRESMLHTLVDALALFEDASDGERNLLRQAFDHLPDGALSRVAAILRDCRMRQSARWDAERQAKQRSEQPVETSPPVTQ